MGPPRTAGGGHVVANRRPALFECGAGVAPRAGMDHVGGTVWAGQRRRARGASPRRTSRTMAPTSAEVNATTSRPKTSNPATAAAAFDGEQQRRHQVRHQQQTARADRRHPTGTLRSHRPILTPAAASSADRAVIPDAAHVDLKTRTCHRNDPSDRIRSRWLWSPHPVILRACRPADLLMVARFLSACVVPGGAEFGLRPCRWNALCIGSRLHGSGAACEPRSDQYQHRSRTPPVTIRWRQRLAVGQGQPRIPASSTPLGPAVGSRLGSRIAAPNPMRPMKARTIMAAP